MDGCTSPRKAKEVEKVGKDYWDTKAFTATFSTPFNIEAFGRHVPNEAKVLDYGCGYGRILAQLSEAGYKDLSGTDSSSEMIERAKQNVIPSVLKVDYQAKRGRRSPYASATFDAVILMNVLSYVVPNMEQMRLIDDCKRILKPNGIIYVMDFLIDFDDDANLVKYNAYKDAYKNEEFDYDYGVYEAPDGALCRHHDPSWIKGLLSEFQQEEYEEISANDHEGNPTRAFFYIGSLPTLAPV